MSVSRECRRFMVATERARTAEIEEAARRQFEADHPNGYGWHNASHWIKDQYREDARKAPR